MFVTALYVIWSQHNAFQPRNAGPVVCKIGKVKVIINKSASHRRHHDWLSKNWQILVKAL